MYKKKLIEVALPLDAISTASVKEKSIRHGHPSTLHLWWSRKPLATSKAIIWASLVDDPSEHPELYPSEEEQDKERERLFSIIEELVKWENLNNQDVIEKALREIEKSNPGGTPVFCDPFAGGGSIPLEAQRLGLKVEANDLNPVAVLINKSMIEIPGKFNNRIPVNPNTSPIVKSLNLTGANILADDLEYYGNLIKKNCKLRILDMYPSIKSNNGKEVMPMAWLWYRTVTCPNPACKHSVPLFNSNVLSKKKGSEAYIEVDTSEPETEYELKFGKTKDWGTVSRKGAICPHCKTPIPFTYIRDEFKENRSSEDLIAVVGEGNKKRDYYSPDENQKKAAYIDRPNNGPIGDLAIYPGYINPVGYGFTEIESLFSNRQLKMLLTFQQEIKDIQEIVKKDAIKAGFPDDNKSLNEGGSGALAYSQAITIYLSFVIDKLADYNSRICSWHNSKELIRNTFGMAGIPMTWNYAEANPFCNSSGSYANMLNWVSKSLRNMPSNEGGVAQQKDAQTDDGERNLLISTDPPYYDAVPHADFSDFFYVWLRNTIKPIFPDLFSTVLTPKEEELTADPFFRGGKEEAAKYFEEGMSEACQSLYQKSSEDYPLTIYYAYKQSDSKETSGKSSGWETMLSAIVNAGFEINGTWPIRTELTNRARGISSNALASSIVLVCRKKSDKARTVPRRKFVAELKKKLKDSLVQLQKSNIAPVDMAQSVIGPGMSVYSKYKAILESNGEPMSIRSALEIINQEVDLFFNEQDSDLHAEDRFCVDLYTQCGFDSIKYGEADTLARAKNTSVEKLAHSGTVFAEKGDVHLIDRDELEEKVDNNASLWMLTQQLVREMDKGGVDAAAKFLKETIGRHESMKSLAYRLFTIAEKKNWAQEAYVYNNLVVAWPEIQDRLAELNTNNFETQTLF